MPPGPALVALILGAIVGSWGPLAGQEAAGQEVAEQEVAGRTREVPISPGQTILEAVRAAGVDAPSSCEQGACGACRCGVIEGTPDHQDVYLSDSEKAAGDQMMICVSRAKSPRLVLDL